MAKIKFTMPMFHHLETPDGFLNPDPACHALFYYATIARRNQENQLDNSYDSGKLVLEGDLDPVFDYRNLFTSIATAYGVQPERMEKFWTNIDMQFNVLKIPKLTGSPRFDKVIAILRTQ